MKKNFENLAHQLFRVLKVAKEYPTYEKLREKSRLERQVSHFPFESKEEMDACLKHTDDVVRNIAAEYLKKNRAA